MVYFHFYHTWLSRRLATGNVVVENCRVFSFGLQVDIFRLLFCS
jgi:hypothetical protein